VTEAVERFSQAFDLLKDRTVFDEALAELREWRSYRTAEERVLRAQIENLKIEIALLEKRLQVKEDAGR
jgi:hypothetical protein